MDTWNSIIAIIFILVVVVFVVLAVRGATRLRDFQWWVRTKIKNMLVDLKEFRNDNAALKNGIHSANDSLAKIEARQGYIINQLMELNKLAPGGGSGNGEAGYPGRQAESSKLERKAYLEPVARSDSRAGEFQPFWTLNQHPEGFEPAIKEVEAAIFDTSVDRFLSSTTVIVWPGAKNPTRLIDKEGISVRFRIDQPSQIIAKIPVAFSKKYDLSGKAGLAWAKAFDKDGRELPGTLFGLPNPRYGSYSYVDNRRSNLKVLDLRTPRNSSEVEIGLVAWEAEFEVSSSFELSREYPNKAWEEKRKLKDIRVAVVLDEFSYKSFEPEFHIKALTPENWRNELEEFKPDLFFCESAWSGRDSKNREWKGRVYSSVNFKKENRTELLGILEYCKSRDIPTAFWNKEDPTHFGDKVHNFVDTALKFDYIFTTDVNMVPEYKKLTKTAKVGCLPFAVQPKLFNPLNGNQRTNELIFAGAWYDNHEQRCATMTSIFNAALEGKFGLKIYDRFYGSTDPLHRYPKKFSQYAHPPVPYGEVAKVYKESKIGLTINTVTNSPTMFARRIFELMASNTYVVSNESIGVEKFFGDNVSIYRDGDEHLFTEMELQAIDEKRRINLRKVLENHTYRNRFETIADFVGIKYKKGSTECLYVVSVKSLQESERAISLWRSSAQYSFETESRLVLLVSSDVDATNCATIFSALNRGSITVVSEALLQRKEMSLQSVFRDASTVVFIPGVKEEFPAFDEIRVAGLHLSYSNSPVLVGQSDHPFEYRGWDVETPIVVSIEDLTNLLQTQPSFEKWNVLGVE